MQGHFDITVGIHPKDSKICVNGAELPNVRGFRVTSSLDEPPSKVEVDMLVFEPFEMSGDGEIVVSGVVVHEEIARQIYVGLKRIFEDENL